jgi:hypothetical protein
MGRKDSTWRTKAGKAFDELVRGIYNRIAITVGLQVRNLRVLPPITHSNVPPESPLG